MTALDDVVDWSARSALTIAPGQYRMRNGHTAEINGRKDLMYGDNKRFPIWLGRCVDCQEPKTWNLNGTFAAVGKHPLDLLERLDESA